MPADQPDRKCHRSWCLRKIMEEVDVFIFIFNISEIPEKGKKQMIKLSKVVSFFAFFNR